MKIGFILPVEILIALAFKIISLNVQYYNMDVQTIFKMDKSAGKAMSVGEADEEMRDYRSYTWRERLAISLFLTSVAYNYPVDSPPKMNKQLCKAQSLQHG